MSGIETATGAPAASGERDLSERGPDERARLSDYTTLRVGGPAAAMIEPETEADLVAAVIEADRAGDPVLILGGGSNLLVGDDGFDGTVIKVGHRGLSADVDSCSGAMITVAAGEPWDAVVLAAVENGWSGLETLSGIPGLSGATPIQNVGAYGGEVSHTLAAVNTLDRRTGRYARFAASDCGFGYRSSMFKREPGRWVVLSVTFQLRLGELSAPIQYAELARSLDVAVGRRAGARAVRDAVLALRGGKGMVLDGADHDTWSAGSFFTNPVLNADVAARLPEHAPRWDQPDGRVKTSAGWLIEHAGFGKGYGMPPATLPGKHVLALTNRGDARSADLLTLARCVRDGVDHTFGVVLEPEPVLVGCHL